LALDIEAEMGLLLDENFNQKLKKKKVPIPRSMDSCLLN
jgi:hypothetical protein